MDFVHYIHRYRIQRWISYIIYTDTGYRDWFLRLYTQIQDTWSLISYNVSRKDPTGSIYIFIYVYIISDFLQYIKKRSYRAHLYKCIHYLWFLTIYQEKILQGPSIYMYTLSLISYNISRKDPTGPIFIYVYFISDFLQYIKKRSYRTHLYICIHYLWFLTIYQEKIIQGPSIYMYILSLISCNISRKRSFIGPPASRTGKRKIILPFN